MVSELLAVQAAGILCAVSTPWKQYDSMRIKTIVAETHGAEAAGGSSALSQGMGGGMTGMEGLGMSGGAGGGRAGQDALRETGSLAEPFVVVSRATARRRLDGAGRRLGDRAGETR